jgi:iron complex outermembrane receptor protein
LKKYKAQMHGAVVFDKVIGRAAACLLAYGKVKKVMTPLASRGAVRLLKENKITIEYLEVVPNIKNKAGDGLCPMEKLSRSKTVQQFTELIFLKKA